jgi:hypothetical protein
MSDKITTAEVFGGCPHCGANDGYFNAGKSHWFFCREHRVKWFYGANIFSSCHEETEAEQREKYDAEGFGTYKYADEVTQ